MKIKNFIYSNQKMPTKTEVGGKAFNLFQLLQLGIHVPKFVVIPNTALQKVLQTINPKNTLEIQQKILEFEFADLHFESMEDYFSPDTIFAVRSSGIDEDGNERSFAGQFETQLCIPFSELPNVVKQIWLSAFSDRVKIYREITGLTFTGNIAVIIQEMVHSDISGVAFGINPLTNQKNERVINAVYGLGEGLVSGTLNADQYVVNAGNIESIVVEKPEKLIFNQEDGADIKLIEVDEKLKLQAALSNKQILEIDAMLTRLEVHYNHPQDIEFAYFNNELFLLQSRPVTTLKNSGKNKHKIIWDNSNIIESYPGLTLPLTYSFILKMYEAVYRQLSAVLGISHKKIDAHADIYANMLGLLKGRVYYNLNSWYTSLSLLPGYAVNAEFMEKMMGMKEKFEFSKEKKKTRLKDYFEIIVAIFSILKNLFTIERQRKQFQSYFNRVMERYENIAFEEKNPAELLDLYFKFEQTLVKKWKAPLVNDFFAMVFFGLLQKQVVKAGFNESENLHNDLISGSKDIITTEPIELTLKITSLILKNVDAVVLFKTATPTEIVTALKDLKYTNIKEVISDYISKWGDRSVGELKLETITYRQNSENYIRVLKSYVQKGLEHNNYFNSATSDIRKAAENKVYAAIKNPIKKIIFKSILKRARYFVSNRENLRYQRTRGFGMVRRIFIALGEKLSKTGILSDTRDIFYLRIEELQLIVNRKMDIQQIAEIIASRKLLYTEFEKLNLPERLSSSNTNTNNIAIPTAHHDKPLVVLDELKGIGCCAGIVRAKIVVVHSPDEIDDLENAILVTSSTDPGWVTLFPTCSAILVERGSLLSHSAIVSRELGIPCIVGIKDLLRSVKSGMEVEMNGSTGVVKIISKP